MPSYRDPTQPTAREIAWLASLAQPDVCTQKVVASDLPTPSPTDPSKNSGRVKDKAE